MADRHVEFVLVGGGVASAQCAGWLRKSGASEDILLVGREPDPPYNRPPCSKGYLHGKESRADTFVQAPGFYERERIELLTRVSATKLDPAERTVTLSSRQTVSFDRALIATGAGVKRLNVPGSELEGIHYLRTLGNADAIREDAAGKRVVLVGGSYIGSEVAATLTDLGSQCTMIMLEALPLSRGFGEQAGRFFGRVLQDHGVDVRGGEELDRFEGADGRVTRVVTKSGLELQADAVIVGAGAQPDVMLARGAGLELGQSGGVRVDSRLQTSAPGVYAAGDMAEYDSVVHGRRLRIEHWDVAFNQGKVAALNMLGREQDYDVVPYFFSDISDWASLEYLGPASRWDSEIVRGSLDDGAFTIFYVDGGRVAAALSVGRSEDLQHARRLIAEGVDVSSALGALGDASIDLEGVSPKP
jgi:3-phenylpropionate/trans-cinnamate dioxygenase ferredoxin reductase subunit